MDFGKVNNFIENEFIRINKEIVERNTLLEEKNKELSQSIKKIEGEKKSLEYKLENKEYKRKRIYINLLEVLKNKDNIVDIEKYEERQGDDYGNGDMSYGIRFITIDNQNIDIEIPMEQRKTKEEKNEPLPF